MPRFETHRIASFLGVAAIVSCAACGFTISAAGGDDGDPDGGGGVSVGFDASSQDITEDATEVTVTVSLSRVSTKRITVPFTVGGNAMANDFNVVTASPIEFAPMTMTQTISIALLEDSAVEGNELVTLTLGTPINASNGAIAEHTVTIIEDDATCYGSGVYSVCVTSVPVGMVTLPAIVDTSPGSNNCAASQPIGWTTSGQPEACFILADSIVVTANARVTGTRPLVLVATSTISVSAVLDASSRRGGTVGPGSPSPSCAMFPSTPDSDSSGAGGGAGGSFMSLAGNGGRGKGGSQNGTAPAALQTVPPRLRAGCDGQRGGTGDVMSGTQGRGGGSVYLVAGDTISIAATGIINASGSGATAAGDSSGGSGGGSGGTIKLHASNISVALGGKLVANGGGASAGADDGGGANPGNDPNPAMLLVPATGGTGPTQVGGAGFAGVVQAASGGNASSSSSNAGGGGGGGGGGLIQSSVAIPSGAASAGLITITP